MPFRKVKLEPEQLRLLQVDCMAATVDRKHARYVDKAEDAVGKIIQFKSHLDGSAEYQLPKAAAEYEFSQDELMGLKLALAQDITGAGQHRPPAPHGRVKYVLRPLARALGLEKLLVKECDLDLEADNPAALTFDDDPAAMPDKDKEVDVA